MKNMNVYICYFQKKLEGYGFPVLSTELCPRNQTEWNKRSSAINCNETNGYMCVPNENLNQLLEFCYEVPSIRIAKGNRGLTFKTCNRAL